MKIKRTFDDGSFDHVDVDTVEEAKTLQIDGDKSIKILQIIEAVSGAVIALIRIFTSVKLRDEKGRFLPAKI